MDKPTSEKRWSELDHEGNRHFFRLLTDRSDKLSDLAYSAWTELAKYLFAANTGAAAGLFLLLRSSNGEREYLTAFFLFCAGVFFVGIGYLGFASWTRELADGSTNDFNCLGRDEFTFGEFDRRNRKRQRSWKRKLARYGLILSFLLLIAGGVTAAKPFWIKPSTSQAAH